MTADHQQCHSLITQPQQARLNLLISILVYFSINGQPGPSFIHGIMGDGLDISINTGQIITCICLMPGCMGVKKKYICMVVGPSFDNGTSDYCKETGRQMGACCQQGRAHGHISMHIKDSSSCMHGKLAGLLASLLGVSETGAAEEENCCSLAGLRRIFR